MLLNDAYRDASIEARWLQASREAALHNGRHPATGMIYPSPDEMQREISEMHLRLEQYFAAMRVVLRHPAFREPPPPAQTEPAPAVEVVRSPGQPILDDDLIRLSSRGMKQIDIARALSTTQGYVSTRLKRLGRSARSVDPAPVERVRELYIESGLSGPQIAAELEVSIWLVKKRMRQGGIQARKTGGLNRKDFPIEKARQLYESGMNLVDVGRDPAIQASSTTVSTRLKAAGVPLRDKFDVLSGRQKGRST